MEQRISPAKQASPTWSIAEYLGSSMPSMQCVHGFIRPPRLNSELIYKPQQLLVTAGLSQLAVAAMGFSCAGGGGGGPQNALGKSPSTTTTATARSLGRGARERRGDKHRWARLADAEHDAEGRADYPLRRSKETVGYSETDPSGSSDSDEQQWKSRKRSAF